MIRSLDVQEQGLHRPCYFSYHASIAMYSTHATHIPYFHRLMEKHSSRSQHFPPPNPPPHFSPIPALPTTHHPCLAHTNANALGNPTQAIQAPRPPPPKYLNTQSHPQQPTPSTTSPLRPLPLHLPPGSLAASRRDAGAGGHAAVGVKDAGGCVAWSLELRGRRSDGGGARGVEEGEGEGGVVEKEWGGVW